MICSVGLITAHELQVIAVKCCPIERLILTEGMSYNTQLFSNDTGAQHYRQEFNHKPKLCSRVANVESIGARIFSKTIMAKINELNSQFVE